MKAVTGQCRPARWGAARGESPRSTVTAVVCERPSTTVGRARRSRGRAGARGPCAAAWCMARGPTELSGRCPAPDSAKRRRIVPFSRYQMCRHLWSVPSRRRSRPQAAPRRHRRAPRSIRNNGTQKPGKFTQLLKRTEKEKSCTKVRVSSSCTPFKRRTPKMESGS